VLDTEELCKAREQEPQENSLKKVTVHCLEPGSEYGGMTIIFLYVISFNTVFGT
jgi:hypothetical protein